MKQMVDGGDNRLPSVMREIIKNSNQYVELMLFHDLLQRNHLDTYLRNNLRQIQYFLHINKDKFVNSNEYTQAKLLFQEKETEFQAWTEKFGNQVRAKKDMCKLGQKMDLENQSKCEKDSKPQEKPVSNK